MTTNLGKALGMNPHLLVTGGHIVQEEMIELHGKQVKVLHTGLGMQRSWWQLFTEFLAILLT
jgi:hypothetical protein